MPRLPYKTACHPTFSAQTLCAAGGRNWNGRTACGKPLLLRGVRGRQRWLILHVLLLVGHPSKPPPQPFNHAVNWVAARSTLFFMLPFSFLIYSCYKKQTNKKNSSSLKNITLNWCSQSFSGGKPASSINSSASPYLTQVPLNNSNILLSNIILAFDQCSILCPVPVTMVLTCYVLIFLSEEINL